MGEEKGGGYSNVEQAKRITLQRAKARRRSKALNDTIVEVCVSDRVNDPEWVKSKLQKLLDDEFWDDEDGGESG